MGLDGLKALGSVNPHQVYRSTGDEGKAAQQSFADTLQRALSEVNNLQLRRDDTVEQMVSGEITEVHEVMVAAQEAQLAFELMLEVRNRLLDSYQEIMRMQA